MKASRTTTALTIAVALALGPLLGAGATASAATTGLRVSGATLTLNHVPFAPRGFTMIGLLAGPGCTNPDTASAVSHFSSDEITNLAVAWHANTVRFQVSQSALSSPDPATVSAYLGSIATGVGYARTAHLAVILSMQDNNLSCGLSHDLPSLATQKAWDALAPVYSGAPDVMYELFNEPIDATAGTPVSLVPLPAASWAEWLEGGSTPDANQGGAVGHQQLLTHLRGLGVRNVILVDGLNRSGILPGPNQGAALVHDTMNPPNVAYSVHPYFYTAGLDQPAHLRDWEFRFGALASSVPVVATEWNYPTANCGTASQTTAPGFLSYLGDRGIGVLGMSGDLRVGTTLLADWNGTPTVCGAGPDGPGAALFAYVTHLPRPTALNLQSTTPVAVGSAVTATGTLLVNGLPPAVGLLVTVTRRDGTIITKLPPVMTGPGGTFSFAAGTATVAGKVKLTVKYAGNALTSTTSKTLTVLVG